MRRTNKIAKRLLALDAGMATNDTKPNKTSVRGTKPMGRSGCRSFECRPGNRQPGRLSMVRSTMKAKMTHLEPINVRPLGCLMMQTIRHYSKMDKNDGGRGMNSAQRQRESNYILAENPHCHPYRPREKPSNKREGSTRINEASTRLKHCRGVHSGTQES